MPSIHSRLMKSSYSSDDEKEEVQQPIPLMDGETRIKADYFIRFCSSLPPSYWGHPEDASVLERWGEIRTILQNLYVPPQY